MKEYIALYFARLDGDWDFIVRVSKTMYPTWRAIFDIIKSWEPQVNFREIESDEPEWPMIWSETP